MFKCLSKHTFSDLVSYSFVQYSVATGPHFLDKATGQKNKLMLICYPVVTQYGCDQSHTKLKVNLEVFYVRHSVSVPRKKVYPLSKYLQRLTHTLFRGERKNTFKLHLSLCLSVCHSIDFLTQMRGGACNLLKTSVWCLKG